MKYIARLILLINIFFFYVLFISCFVKHHKKSTVADSITQDPIQIIASFAQPWVGGVKGSGSGVNYEFQCIIKKTNSYIIDQLWVGENFLTPSVWGKSGSYLSNGYNCNDTIFIRANQHFNSGKSSENDTSKVTSENKVPFKFSGDALIGYKLKDKRKYITVINMVKKQTLYYP